jgi:prevent-host-death family protein
MTMDVTMDKKIPAGTFKTHCLAIMDEVQTKRQSVIITKRGKAVAKLVPVSDDSKSIFNFLEGKGTTEGDIVAPALSKKEWGNLS